MDQLEIQVLDDSTDETTALLSAHRVPPAGPRPGYPPSPPRPVTASSKVGALGADREQAGAGTGGILTPFHPAARHSAANPAGSKSPDCLRPDPLGAPEPRLLPAHPLAVTGDQHAFRHRAGRPLQDRLWLQFQRGRPDRQKAAIPSPQAAGNPTPFTEGPRPVLPGFPAGWQAVYLADVGVPTRLPVSGPRIPPAAAPLGAPKVWEVAYQLFAPVWQHRSRSGRKVEASPPPGWVRGPPAPVCAGAACSPLVLLVSGGHPRLTGLLGAALAFNATAFADPFCLPSPPRSLFGRSWLRQLQRSCS